MDWPKATNCGLQLKMGSIGSEFSCKEQPLPWAVGQLHWIGQQGPFSGKRKATGLEERLPCPTAPGSGPGAGWALLKREVGAKRPFFRSLLTSSCLKCLTLEPKGSQGVLSTGWGTQLNFFIWASENLALLRHRLLL